MSAYLRSVWGCRYFWLSLVKNDLRSRYRGSFLGMGWSLLQPILMTIILCTAFSMVFGQHPKKFAPYLLAGLTLWGFVTAVTQAGTQCFFQGESYIRQFPAPMAIYPLRTVLGAGFHLLVGLVPVLGLCAYKNGEFAGPLVLLNLLPTLGLVVLAGWAVCTLMGVANVHFRDTKHLSEVALQGLFYLTPIMYPPELIEKRRTLGKLLELNPLMPFLRLMRDTLLDNQTPAASTYLAAAFITAALMAAAAATLRLQERRLIFYL
jgi:lipopolysaccharide transport system permease protein